jgi:hypothetical protein
LVFLEKAIHCYFPTITDTITAIPTQLSKDINTSSSERSNTMNIKDFLLLQRFFKKSESDYPHSSHKRFFERGFSRRGFIHRAAGATGLAFGSGLTSMALADHDNRRDERDNFEEREGDADADASPLPIPGGLQLIPGDPEVFHIFLPGGPEGNDFEPSVITDFKGRVGLAIVRGTGTGINTETKQSTRLDFEVDLRFMTGTYLGMCDRKRHHGAFALI